MTAARPDAPSGIVPGFRAAPPPDAPGGSAWQAAFTRVLDRLLRFLACLFLVMLLCCVLAGIVTRALGEPLIWTDEGARFLMAWLASSGWMIAARNRAHVRIRFFHNLLPDRPRAVTERMIQLTVCVLGGAVAVYGVLLVQKNLDLEATSLPLSMAWLYMPLIPSGTLICLQSAADAVRPPLVGSS